MSPSLLSFQALLCSSVKWGEEQTAEYHAAIKNDVVPKHGMAGRGISDVVGGGGWGGDQSVKEPVRMNLQRMQSIEVEGSGYASRLPGFNLESPLTS